MTIRFASTTRDYSTVIARSILAPAPLDAANDNAHSAANDRFSAGDDRMLWEALRHFADHGLHAAQEAAQSARTAFDADDIESFEWWLSICRMLDRRLGDSLERLARAS